MTFRRHEIPRLMVLILVYFAMKTSHGASPIEFSLAVKGMTEAVKLDRSDPDWIDKRNPGVIPLAPGEPLELQLSAVNSTDKRQNANVNVRVISASGPEVWSQALDRSFPVGRTETTFKLFDKPGAPQEGMFLAQVLNASDEKELAELNFGCFPAVPDIPETVDAAVLILRDRKLVGTIEAQRSWPKLPDYTRHDPILAQTSDGRLYAMFQENHYAEDGDTRAQRPTFVWSTDEGRSWQMRQITLDPPVGGIEAVRSFGVAANDHLFVAYAPVPDASPEEMLKRFGQRDPAQVSIRERHARHTDILSLFVARSSDGGATWSKSVEVDVSKYVRAQGLGRFYQATEDTIWFTCCLVGPYKHDLGRYYDSVIRSSDGGVSWGDVSLMVPNSGECQLLHLASGRWLTTIRSVDRPGDRIGPDGKQVNLFGLDKLPTYDKTAEAPWVPGRGWYLMHKRTFIAESEDGRNWGDFRQMTTIFGDTPGELIQLPDGRVVFLYCHRYAPHHGLYARISHDEGRTWQPELVGLRNLDYGYSSSTVLKNGTIVSMIGGETIQAVRWRLPAEL